MTTAAAQTFTITDAKGTRQITLAEFRAEIDARAVAAKPIMDAWKRGDLAACEAAQAAMRKRFPA